MVNAESQDNNLRKGREDRLLPFNVTKNYRFFVSFPFSAAIF